MLREQEAEQQADDAGLLDASDEMMLDAVEHDEEAQLDALISSYPPNSEPSSRDMQRPESPHFSDDEDYDALFMDYYLSREQQGTQSSEMDLQ